MAPPPPSLRRTRGPVAAIVAAALLAGCGGTSSSGSAPSAGDSSPSASSTSSASFQAAGSDFRAIRALLARRARAVLHHDRRAFLATVDPAQHAVVAQQTDLYDNLAAMRISSLSYAVDDSALVPAAIPGGDPVLRPGVVEHLRVTPTFTRPVSNPLDVTFVRRDGHWLLGAETQPSDSQAFDSPQERPWFGVPIAVRQQGPMTVMVDRSHAASLDQVTTAVAQDIRFDSGVLGVPASYRILVDATSNGLSHGFSSLSKEEAAAVTFPVLATDRAGTSSTGLATMAIKLNPHEVDQVVNDTGVMRHELTHYLLRRYTGSSPKWLVEGVATWIQYYPDDFARLRVSSSFYHRLMRADRALPTIGLFNEAPDLNYPISQAAVAWLVTTYGVAKLITLMKAYRSAYAGVNSDALTSKLFRQVYGVDQATVVRGTFGELASFQH